MPIPFLPPNQPNKQYNHAPPGKSPWMVSRGCTAATAGWAAPGPRLLASGAGMVSDVWWAPRVPVLLGVRMWCWGWWMYE